MLIPYINLLINTISKKEFEILLIIGIVFFYVLPTISKVTLVDDGYGITNFIYLYLFGAYIRKYYNNNVSIIKAIFLYLVMTFITTCLSFITTHVWSYATIFNLISSISLFEIFKSLKIDHNIVINKLAIYTFSVYLIDINLQHYLYRTLFHSNQYWNSPLMIVNLIISVFGIYVICIIMDWLRVVLFGKLFSYISSLVKCKIEVKNSSNN